MIFTTEMIQLFAVVLAKDCEPVTETLLREGVMQFINISELESEESETLSEIKTDISLTKITDLRKRIEGFLFTGSIIPPAPQETDLNRRTAVNIEKENSSLDKIAGELESIRERQRVLQQEIHKLEDIKRQVELYGIGISDVTLPAKHTFIAMQIGKLPAVNVKKFEDALRDMPSLSVALGQEDDMSHHLLISMKRDNEQINKILSKVGWSKVELPGELRTVKKDIFNEITTKLQKLVEEQKKAEIKVHDLMKKEQKHLSETWTNLRINELFFKIQENFKSSSRTVIFTGWLPSAKKERLTKKIKQACENRCYLEWNEAGSAGVIGDEAPVRLNNPKVLAPFQMLVSNFGTPQYGTIDPTPFVMPLYLAMFGLMFADVGHGFVLTLLGLSGILRFRKNEDQTGWYQFSWLILWCSLSAILFGVLFGSYFGFGLFKPLWFDYHGIVSGHAQHNSAFQDISDILAITIYFGIFVIILGLSFNWINLVRKREWMELIFDKGGFLGGWIYGGGVYVIYNMVSHNNNGPLPGGLIFLLVGLPALLLFVKEPYHFFKHKKEHTDQKFGPVAILNFFMGWSVELLEIFGGYLSNTLSFMRVAALGIAHVALMITFFDIAKMAPVWGAIIILILGNLLVIGLEGLSAGIQALRLNYYEFFTKFFHGTGKLYTPISLSSKYR